MNNETAPQETQDVFRLEREAFYRSFSVSDMEELARYQESLDIEKLIASPVSLEFEKKFSDTMHLLLDNFDTYDNVPLTIDGENIMCEDLIFERDDIVSNLLAKRAKLSSGTSLLNEKIRNGQIEDCSRALRVRVNVLGYLLSSSPFSPKSIVDIDQSENEETEEQEEELAKKPKMAFEDYKIKKSVIIVYTGAGKGKTSAALGLMARALGNRWNVAFIQFIKYWGVSEHVFIRDIQALFNDQLHFYKGGKGFYKAGELSEANISAEDHKKAAAETFKEAMECAGSGKFDLVICDEINNAVHDGLLTVKDLKSLISKRSPKTSLCLTGRDFPKELLKDVDIATDMKKIKHHFDDKFLANKGIDF